MKLEELIQLQVLKRRAGNRGRITEHVIENTDSPAIRQMCAKVSAELITDLESVCTLLDVSKREFIEAAVVEAVRLAEEHIEKAGGPEGLGFHVKEA